MALIPSCPKGTKLILLDIANVKRQHAILQIVAIKAKEAKRCCPEWLVHSNGLPILSGRLWLTVPQKIVNQWRILNFP